MSKYVIPNLSNACRLLSLVVNSNSGLTRDEISEVLGIPRTTVYRILQTFVGEGFFDQRNHRYYPGAGLFRLGLKLGSVDRLRPIVRPILHQLSALTGFTSHLAIPSGYKTLLLDVCDGENLSKVASRPGTVAPIHVSATGKVFLAHLLADEVPTIEREVGFEKFTARTRKSVADIRKDIQLTLMRGYGLDDREFSDKIRCLACPLFDLSGSVVAAIGITSSVEQFDVSQIPDVAAIVKQHSQKCYQLLKNQ